MKLGLVLTAAVAVALAIWAFLLVTSRGGSHEPRVVVTNPASSQVGGPAAPVVRDGGSADDQAGDDKSNEPDDQAGDGKEDGRDEQNGDRNSNEPDNQAGDGKSGGD